MNEWEPMETAPHGQIVLAECKDGDTSYICSVVYWTAEALAESCGGGWYSARDYEPYWSRSSYDDCVEPVRWLKGFEFPETLEIMI